MVTDDDGENKTEPVVISNPMPLMEKIDNDAVQDNHEPLDPKPAQQRESNILQSARAPSPSSSTGSCSSSSHTSCSGQSCSTDNNTLNGDDDSDDSFWNDHYISFRAEPISSYEDRASYEDEASSSVSTITTLRSGNVGSFGGSQYIQNDDDETNASVWTSNNDDATTISTPKSEDKPSEQEEPVATVSDDGRKLSNESLLALYSLSNVNGLEKEEDDDSSSSSHCSDFGEELLLHNGVQEDNPYEDPSSEHSDDAATHEESATENLLRERMNKLPEEEINEHSQEEVAASFPKFSPRMLKVGPKSLDGPKEDDGSSSSHGADSKEGALLVKNTPLSQEDDNLYETPPLSFEYSGGMMAACQEKNMENTAENSPRVNMEDLQEEEITSHSKPSQDFLGELKSPCSFAGSEESSSLHKGPVGPKDVTLSNDDNIGIYGFSSGDNEDENATSSRYCSDALSSGGPILHFDSKDEASLVKAAPLSQEDDNLYETPPPSFEYSGGMMAACQEKKLDDTAESMEELQENEIISHSKPSQEDFLRELKSPRSLGSLAGSEESSSLHKGPVMPKDVISSNDYNNNIRGSSSGYNEDENATPLKYDSDVISSCGPTVISQTVDTMKHFPPNATLGSHTNCYSEPNEKEFYVRGPKYFKNRRKVVSGPFLFPTRGVDVFLTDSPPLNIGSNPSVLGGQVRDVPTFIMNFRLSFGVVVLYYEIPSHLVPYLKASCIKDGSAVDHDLVEKMADLSPGERTAARFLMGDTAYRNDKLKIVPKIVQGPWIVKKAVGSRPVIIGKKLPGGVSYVYQPEENNNNHNHNLQKRALYLEADLNAVTSVGAGRFANMARKHKSALTLDVGFVVQGDEEDELPEQMLAGVRFHGIDLDNAQPLPVINQNASSNGTHHDNEFSCLSDSPEPSSSELIRETPKNLPGHETFIGASGNVNIVEDEPGVFQNESVLESPPPSVEDNLVEEADSSSNTLVVDQSIQLEDNKDEKEPQEYEQMQAQEDQSADTINVAETIERPDTSSVRSTTSNDAETSRASDQTPENIPEGDRSIQLKEKDDDETKPQEHEQEQVNNYESAGLIIATETIEKTDSSNVHSTTSNDVETITHSTTSSDVGTSIVSDVRPENISESDQSVQIEEDYDETEPQQHQEYEEHEEHEELQAQYDESADSASASEESSSVYSATSNDAGISVISDLTPENGIVAASDRVCLSNDTDLPPMKDLEFQPSPLSIAIPGEPVEEEECWERTRKHDPPASHSNEVERIRTELTPTTAIDCSFTADKSNAIGKTEDERTSTTKADSSLTADESNNGIERIRNEGISSTGTNRSSATRSRADRILEDEILSASADIRADDRNTSRMKKRGFKPFAGPVVEEKKDSAREEAVSGSDISMTRIQKNDRLAVLDRILFGDINTSEKENLELQTSPRKLKPRRKATKEIPRQRTGHGAGDTKESSTTLMATNKDRISTKSIVTPDPAILSAVDEFLDEYIDESWKKQKNQPPLFVMSPVADTNSLYSDLSGYNFSIDKEPGAMLSSGKNKAKTRNAIDGCARRDMLAETNFLGDDESDEEIMVSTHSSGSSGSSGSSMAWGMPSADASAEELQAILEAKMAKLSEMKSDLGIDELSSNSFDSYSDEPRPKMFDTNNHPTSGGRRGIRPMTSIASLSALIRENMHRMNNKRSRPAPPGHSRPVQYQVNYSPTRQIRRKQKQVPAVNYSPQQIRYQQSQPQHDKSNVRHQQTFERQHGVERRPQQQHDTRQKIGSVSMLNSNQPNSSNDLTSNTSNSAHLNSSEEEFEDEYDTKKKENRKKLYMVFAFVTCICLIIVSGLVALIYLIRPDSANEFPPEVMNDNVDNENIETPSCEEADLNFGRMDMYLDGFERDFNETEINELESIFLDTYNNEVYPGGCNDSHQREIINAVLISHGFSSSPPGRYLRMHVHQKQQHLQLRRRRDNEMVRPIFTEWRLSVRCGFINIADENEATNNNIFRHQQQSCLDSEPLFTDHEGENDSDSYNSFVDTFSNKLIQASSTGSIQGGYQGSIVAETKEYGTHQ